MKTVKEFTELARSELRSLYDESEAEQIAFLLLEEVKSFSRSDLQLKRDEMLSEHELDKLNDFIKQLKFHKPLQYILGYSWFCGMKFFVDRNVLIPRPETEELVEWILNLETRTLKLEILDVGTGSGCIPIAIKKNLPSASVHSVDISEGALVVAKKNAELNQAEVLFLKGDILSSEFRSSLKNKFDIVVSNPPYVRKNEMNSITESVKNYEPHSAIFVVNDDVLIFYKAIAELALTHLKENGKVFFEINQSMGKEVEFLLREKGFQNVEVKKDMSGKDRMIMATRFAKLT